MMTQGSPTVSRDVNKVDDRLPLVLGFEALKSVFDLLLVIRCSCTVVVLRHGDNDTIRCQRT